MKTFRSIFFMSCICAAIAIGQDYVPSQFWESEWQNVEGWQSQVRLSCGADNIFSARWHYVSIERRLLPHAVTFRNNQNLCILDVGSGAGYWISFWSSFYPGKVYGSDISKTCVEALRARFPEVPCLAIDVSDPAIADSLAKYNLLAEYTIISAMNMIHHLVDDAAFDRAFENFGNLLVPGGAVFITTGLEKMEEWWYKKYRPIEKFQETAERHGLYIHEVTREEHRKPFKELHGDLIVILKEKK